MLHDAVEDGGLGRAPLVLQCIGQLVTDESVIRHEQERVRVACLPPDALSGREKVAARPGVIVRSRPGRDGAFTACPSPAHLGRVRSERAHPVSPTSVLPCRPNTPTRSHPAQPHSEAELEVGECEDHVSDCNPPSAVRKRRVLRPQKITSETADLREDLCGSHGHSGGRESRCGSINPRQGRSTMSVARRSRSAQRPTYARWWSDMRS